MDYRLLAIDLDDTLLDKHHRISSFNQQVIATARAQGIEVILATGRMYCSALPYYEKLNLSSPMINYNGALVVDETGHYLVHAPLSPSLSWKVLQAMEDYPCHINLYVGDTLYARQDGKELQLYQEIAGVQGELVQDLYPLLEGSPTKMVAISLQEGLLQTMEEDLAREFGDSITLTPTRYGFLEVMAPGISKGKALAQVVKEFHLLPEEVVAFGDGLNDLSMLEYAGLGVAMAEGNPRLKEEADCIVSSGDGVGELIQKTILQGVK